MFNWSLETRKTLNTVTLTSIFYAFLIMAIIPTSEVGQPYERAMICFHAALTIVMLLQRKAMYEEARKSKRDD